MSSELNILMPSEIDLYVDSMRSFSLEAIGTPGWLEWHQRLQKLHQQAVLEAASYREEATKEVINLKLKVNILVYEAITTAIWRLKVLPLLMEMQPEDTPTNLTVYIVLMHEATAASLLEIVMFHSESCENIGENIIDLVDYAADSIYALVGLIRSGYKGNVTAYNASKESDNLKEITRQGNDLLFSIGTRCLTIISYIVEHLPKLPLGVGNRLVSTHDIPILMAEMLSCQPWITKDEKGFHKYINGRWQIVSGDTILKVGPTEAHVWLCLRQLLLDQEIMVHYELTDFRRNQLSKLQRYMNDHLLDQLPILGHLKTFLCQLPLTGPADTRSSKKNILLEIVPEIKQNILNKYDKKWNKIAQKQAKILFTRDHEEMVEMAKRLSSAYSNEILEHFEEDVRTKCENCGKLATKKCSRCKGEWYCNRQCQVERWALHKDICDQLVKDFLVK